VTRTRTIAPLGLLLVALVACGEDEAASPNGERADRTVEVDMVDIAFAPETIDVAAGETVRFVFTNSGDVAHDAFIGDDSAQDDHAAEMADDHGGHDEDGEGITVEPGDTAELTHTFGADDDGLLIGCHQPGHYDAGMVATIDVA
jgi:uncharacterized cupredoxin-like copper-binding protein